MSNSWLTRPFDLSHGAIYTLSFANWYKIESGVDFAYVAIDHNYDGIYTILATYTGNSPTWQIENIDIPDTLCTSYARLAFILQADQEIVNTGIVLDDIAVEPRINVDLHVFLEGPYSGPDMNTLLNADGLIPLSQPYNTSPWNYTGTENVPAMPNTLVTDWFLLELRDAASATSAIPATSIARQAAFLLNDGSLVGLDGSSLPEFNVEIDQNLFVVFYHRNHLPVMSSTGLIGNAGVYSYDLSTGSGQAYNNGQKLIGSGVWGMYAGDADASSEVDALDYSIWRSHAGENGYFGSDVNLDSETGNKDKNDLIYENFGVQSQVPE
jgi:hypothetical protein